MRRNALRVIPRERIFTVDGNCQRTERFNNERRNNARNGRVSSRRVCLVLNPKIAAAEISVRRLARTSERTSMRCSSRPLIVTKSNLCLPNLIFGRVVWTFQLCTNRTLQLCAYTKTTDIWWYRTYSFLFGTDLSQRHTDLLPSFPIGSILI